MSRILALISLLLSPSSLPVTKTTSRRRPPAPKTQATPQTTTSRSAPAPTRSPTFPFPSMTSPKRARASVVALVVFVEVIELVNVRDVFGNEFVTGLERSLE